MYIGLYRAINKREEKVLKSEIHFSKFMLVDSLSILLYLCITKLLEIFSKHLSLS